MVDVQPVNVVANMDGVVLHHFIVILDVKVNLESVINFFKIKKKKFYVWKLNLNSLLPQLLNNS